MQDDTGAIPGTLAVPVLLFLVILAIWSAVVLARLYRAADDPDRFRGKRRRRRRRRRR